MAPTGWVAATVIAIHDETATAKTFRFRLGHPSTHLAGQHYIIRLTAPDGYRAQRSYSVASPPDGTDEVEFTVERLPGGEVSSFLHDEVQVGDELELRGPIGGWFVWQKADGPALLIGGGSGVVPLMAMLRLARRQAVAQLVRLVVSVRRPQDLYYAAELTGPGVTVIYTREAPVDYHRPPGRLNPGDLKTLVVEGDMTGYICGSSPFADAATEAATAAGVPVEHIRVERFGPSG
jgi:ferredoxin-NADP reductase